MSHQAESSDTKGGNKEFSTAILELFRGDTILIEDRVSVVGFDVPNSPDASYNNAYPCNEDEGREPPILPPHLLHSLLNNQTNGDQCRSLRLPQNVTLNHLYIENREPPRSVVALGVTHRFRSKFITVVLYKPVPRR